MTKKFFLIFFTLITQILSFSFTAHSKDQFFNTELICYYYNPQKMVASISHNPYWTLARQKGHGALVQLSGYQEDYFFFVTDKNANYDSLVRVCEESIPKGMKLLDMEALASFFTLRGLRIGFENYHYSPMKKIVLFGDSLSDTGNLQKWLRVIPTGTTGNGYWMGRFSNGPVWIEYLSRMLGSSGYLNWSYGGMKTSDVHDVPFKDLKNKLREYGRNYATSNLLKEIDRYFKLKEVKEESARHTLYAFWVGANNYLDKIEINSTYSKIWKELQDTKYRKSLTAKRFVELTVNDIMEGIEKIYQGGGRNFVVAGLPDMSGTPSAIKQQKEHIFYFMVVLHNLKLQEELKLYLKEKNDPSLSIHYVDTEKYMENFFSDASYFGFTHLNTPCYQGDYVRASKNEKMCQDPEHYIFFDHVHPTTRAHCLIAWYVHQDLYENGFITIAPRSYEEQNQIYCQ